MTNNCYQNCNQSNNVRYVLVFIMQPDIFNRLLHLLVRHSGFKVLIIVFGFVQTNHPRNKVNNHDNVIVITLLYHNNYCTVI